MRTICVELDAAANALDLSPDNLQVVIAGRHVFKIYALEEEDLIEKANLRAGKNPNLNFSCNDVVWNPIEDTILATAATNGAVVTWNLNKSSRSKLDCVFNDHKRTVNKVSFHPSEPHQLISGSQDGFMKLFDLRRKEAAYTFTSNAESVRDVQFNPHFNMQFCAVAENGNVQLWDMRKTDRMEKQFTAHGGPIFALDWHPEIKSWIATAGRDKTIKICDVYEAPNVRHTIQTIASVQHVKWRPNSKYHIASSALIWDCSINVWDIRRPYMPFAAFNEHKKLTSGIVWRGDPNSLLSVGRDSLIHHAFKDATKPMEKVNPHGLDISVFGNISNATHIKEDSEPQGALAKLSLFRKSPALNEHYGQVLSSVHMIMCEEKGPLSPHHLVHSARNYLLTGKSLAEICEHNAAVARKLNRPQIALTWQMLQLLYVGVSGGTDTLMGIQSSSRDDPAVQPDTSMENDQRSSRHYSGGDGGDTSGGGFSAEEGDTETDDTDNHDLKLTHIASGMTINQDFFFGDGEINQMPFDYDNLNNFDTSQDWTLPNEAFQPRHEILYPSAMPPQDYHSKCSPREIQEAGSASGYIVEPQSLLSEVRGLGTPVWECTELVVEMLYHYASNGDVQMSVTCVIVLGDRLKEHLEKDQVEHWFLSYINLLQQFQLWNIATQVIQLAENTGLPAVQQLNQQSTTVTLQCGQCGANVLRNSLFCRKCGCPTSACAVCHGMVRGLFVWCQGCTHGGHLHHMMKWMANNKSCPAGCGHLCEYT